MNVPSSRAFTLMLVLLALGVVATVLLALQATSFRQAASGRETAARFRAHWAARAGVESVIAQLERSLEAGSSGSAYSVLDDMDSVSSGEVAGATWSIVHTTGSLSSSEEREGPEDAHSKINVNLMTAQDLMVLEGMTEDMADSILDWIDEDDSANPLGAEAGYYSQLPSPYEPRNGPMQSLFELELVAGITPELVRGEDWNLNGRLDPNENDGDLSWPPDNADGSLDAGWSAFITASSVEPGWGASGQARLNLTRSSADELVARIPTVDVTQATVILEYAARGDTRIEGLLTNTLQQIAQNTAGLPTTVRNLQDDQLRLIFDECTFDDPEGAPKPGRVNINTVSRDALDYIVAIPPALADAIILGRDSAPQGFVNMMDLLEVPSMSRQRLFTLSEFLGVEANAFTISSLGRDSATGTESEIVCVVRGISLPVSLTEKRVR